jgi:two-component system, OmpR family, sensor histidine kinase KdpD
LWTDAEWDIGSTGATLEVTVTDPPDREEAVADATTHEPVTGPGARTVAGYVLASLGTMGLVRVLLAIREDVDPLSKGFAFLVLVVLTVGVGGLGPGLVASVLGFVCFNYFFLPPYDTFAIQRAEDIVVLFVFLGLSVLISVLVSRARARAEAAEAREQELRLQLDLSRALVEPRVEAESYELVLRLVVRRFGYRAGSLFVQPKADLGGLEEAANVEISTDPSPSAGDEEMERLPLNVGRRNLGLLVLRGTRPPLSQRERRGLETFGNQLALVLERDRLLRAAAEAEQARGSTPR